MTNLTLAIEEDLLRQARIRALEQGTSVNALLRTYLEQYVGVRNRRAKALSELRAISERVESGSGGRTWTRDELHER